jgi:predicted GH43/DUF377 family glycosyl hydrolase
LFKQSALQAFRFFNGAPILAPTDWQWESGVTFNAAATYLPPSEANRRLTSVLLAGTVSDDDRLRDGMVVVHYRARPRVDPGYLIARSYVGLALFSTDFELIYRFPEPVLSPGNQPTDVDYLGIEDPRVTRVGDEFHMVYCGSGLDAHGKWAGAICTARSTDLLRWEKYGALGLNISSNGKDKRFDNTYFDNLAGAGGSASRINNKDGVLLPDRIDRRFFLLHRPMIGSLSSWAIHLAEADEIDGAWRDCGAIFRGASDAAWIDSWVGAGAVPLPLGGNRYLAIIHTGHRAADGSRLYTLDALVLNFNDFDPKHPERVVESRLDRLMTPQTRWETEGPYPDSVGNVLFSCGAFERNGEIYVIYGGGDTYVMAARLNKAEVLAAMVAV